MAHKLYSGGAAGILMLAALAAIPGGLYGVAQRTFPTPQDAVDALVQAVKSDNADQIAAVLGDPLRDQFETSTTQENALDRLLFIDAVQASSRFEQDGNNRLTLVVGKNDWPFPVPLVYDGTSWRFDSAAGAQEIQDRRIGRNEIHAVETCIGYVQAQFDYFRIDHNGDGFLEFAQRLVSSPGKRNGLYWQDNDGGSPLGPGLAQSASGYGGMLSHSGYDFRLLTAQGPKAIGGVRSYLIGGRLLGGFGLIAWPTQYGVTGVQTFMVNQLGTVYAADLGANTVVLAARINAFNPDGRWKELQEQPQPTSELPSQP